MGFLISFLSSLVCLAIHQILLSLPIPPPGEYFWSTLALQNYTVFTGVLVSVSALLIAYKRGGNPVIIGFGAVAIFPVIAFIEATIYRGSHNLIPFELVVYAVYSFPPIIGAVVGSLIKKYSRPAQKI